MQQVIDDKLRVSIPFLGGINEQADVLDLPLEEFKSSVGTFPQFSGMLARIPGKVAIRYETSPVRLIHQSFSGGSFCFYAASDRLLFYNDCQNPSYTVKPETPTDLGTTDDGQTLDVFGGIGYVPIGIPNLSFSPKCIPQGTAPTADPDPDEGGDGDVGYTIQTDFFNLADAHALFFSLDYGNGYEVHLFAFEGGGFTVGPGEVYDFLPWLEDKFTLLGDPLVRLRIQEGTGIDTQIGIATIQPPGALQVTGNVVELTGATQWDEIEVEFQIEPFDLGPPRYILEVGSYVGDDGDEIEIDFVYGSSFYLAGPQFVKGVDFTVATGNVINFTDNVIGSLTFFGQPLTQIRVYKRVGAVKTELGIEFTYQTPADGLEITSTTPGAWGAFNDNLTIVAPGSVDWSDMICFIALT